MKELGELRLVSECVRVIQIQQLVESLLQRQTMPIPIQQIVYIYEHIQEQINIDYVSVVIYTAIDIDSLCSIKMLSKFFKGQSIQFHVHPVTSYSQLDRKIQEAKESYKAVNMFMFINCGGLTDLTESWFIKEGGQKKIFLFDSNKPMNHKNLEHKSIIVVDDEHSEMNRRVTSEDVKTLEELEHLQIEQIENEEENEEENTNSPKRGPNSQLIQKLRQKSQFLHEKMNSYYGSSYVSAPTSYSLYRFIRELKRASNYTLWWAIVGLTGLYLENGIPRELFTHLTNYYRGDLVQFNPQGNEKKEKGQIFLKKGYNFPLMNHWSLYDSMMNSPYLMMKLGLWNDKGITKLHQILTKLGISLEQAKQNYKYMLKEMKDALEAKIFTITTEYNLGEISFESFMRQTDSSTSYMASDFYHIITSVLEKPVLLTNELKGTLEERKLSKQQTMNEERIAAFWSAYNLLDGSQDMLKTAVDQYKEMSALMMKEVRDIIQRDSIMHMGRKLDFSNIRCDTRQKKLLEHPTALIRLAHILMGIQKERRKQTQQKKGPIPYVVSLLDIDYSVCLVVGVTPQRKNHLGTKFNQAAQKLKLHVIHDKFTPNVIIIEKDNLLPFIMEVGQKKKQ